jgi:hypothetical protein
VSGRRREIKLKRPVHTGDFNPAAVYRSVPDTSNFDPAQAK